MPSGFLRKMSSANRIVRTIRNWPRALLDHAGVSKKPYICETRNGLRIWIRAGTDDSRVLFEVYCRKCYKAAMVLPGSVVIDVGANIGCYSLLAALNAARVLAFEPHPGNFAILRKNCELNNATNVELFPVAISGEAGMAPLYLPDDETFFGRFSLFSGRGERVIEVNRVTLAQILEDAGIGQVDVIKIDCQGAEYDILYGADKETLSRVRQIIVECEHFPDPAPPRFSQFELQTYLEGSGFSVSADGNLLYACREPAPRSCGNAEARS